MADPQLYEELKELRLRLASEKRVPAYVIFTDATLRDMTVRRPHSWDDLLQVNGVGEGKRERYGDAFLALFCLHDGFDYTPCSDMGTTYEHEKPTLSARQAGNAGRPWSSQEDERLRASFDQDVSIGELCAEHERSAYAIRARLRRLGLTE